MCILVKVALVVIGCTALCVWIVSLKTVVPFPSHCAVALCVINAVATNIRDIGGYQLVVCTGRAWGCPNSIKSEVGADTLHLLACMHVTTALYSTNMGRHTCTLLYFIDYCI